MPGSVQVLAGSFTDRRGVLTPDSMLLGRIKVGRDFLVLFRLFGRKVVLKVGIEPFTQTSQSRGGLFSTLHSGVEGYSEAGSIVDVVGSGGMVSV